MKRMMSLSQRKAWWGVLFALPLIIGLIMLFILPLIQSFRYSMSSLQLVEGGFELIPKGFDNYRSLLVSNPDYMRQLTESVVNMVINVPIIIIFSLFAAVLLNQKFRGRSFARAVFFLPVILASSAIAGMDISSFVGGSISGNNAGDSGTVLESFELKKMMLEAGMGQIFVDYLTGAVDRIYEIISSSGVQMLIFLAGLQSISPSLYEASKIEGATGYETFWKVTFPMMTPLILTNMVYSIIDSFSGDKINKLVSETAFKVFDFGLSAAMSWIYFVVVAILLSVAAGILSRKVFYYD
ncbi:carbohydrate ABC transporter permease [Paenibacillus marinisediminis]